MRTAYMRANRYIHQQACTPTDMHTIVYTSRTRLPQPGLQKGNLKPRNPAPEIAPNQEGSGGHVFPKKVHIFAIRIGVGNPKASSSST